MTRYKQDKSLCAVASSASTANYYNPEIDYLVAKRIARKHVTSKLSDGMRAGQIGLLLNALGFNKVRLIACDVNIVDFAWNKFSNIKKIEAIQDLLNSGGYSHSQRFELKCLKKFLSNPGYKNELIVDNHFGEHIRTALDERKPVMASYNWTMLCRTPKQNRRGNSDFINGTCDYHEVCLRGYSEDKVYIVDSHHEFYKRKLKCFSGGYYSVYWEELLLAMGIGDIIIPMEYDKNKIKI